MQAAGMDWGAVEEARALLARPDPGPDPGQDV